ncbi:MAG TPA: hypothetical protein VJJ83_03335 [Candidatus Babeliales bacterium]|nr:hypothetical protein [Candidatus Babeliales bacterium]
MIRDLGGMSNYLKYGFLGLTLLSMSGLSAMADLSALAIKSDRQLEQAVQACLPQQRCIYCSAKSVASQKKNWGRRQLATHLLSKHTSVEYRNRHGFFCPVADCHTRLMQRSFVTTHLLRLHPHFSNPGIHAALSYQQKYGVQRGAGADHYGVSNSAGSGVSAATEPAMAAVPRAVTPVRIPVMRPTAVSSKRCMSQPAASNAPPAKVARLLGASSPTAQRAGAATPSAFRVTPATARPQILAAGQGLWPEEPALSVRLGDTLMPSATELQYWNALRAGSFCQAAGCDADAVEGDSDLEGLLVAAVKAYRPAHRLVAAPVSRTIGQVGGSLRPVDAAVWQAAPLPPIPALGPTSLPKSWLSPRPVASSTLLPTDCRLGDVQAIEQLWGTADVASKKTVA